MSADDLTGGWLGIFSYPHSLPPTAFTARIDQRGAVLTGTVVERDTIEDGRPLQALIDGRCDGRGVRFAKLYEDEGGDYDLVSYAGTVSGDGSEITGRWDIAGVWSGTFIMTRRIEAPPIETFETADRIGD